MSINIRLTPRQQTFLDTLFDLYKELKGPVHYSLVADRLGVNKFSAYDMLRVLEEKDVVASEYVLDDDHTGPGRSIVVFYPTNRAVSFLSRLRDEVMGCEEIQQWQKLKKNLLTFLDENRDANPVEVLQDFFNHHLQDAPTPLAYCAAMTTALLLNLTSFQEETREHLESLRSLIDSGPLGLGTLAGLGLSSAMTQISDPCLKENLIEYASKYQAHLYNMSEESISRLLSLLQDAISVSGLFSTAGDAP